MMGSRKTGGLLRALLAASSLAAGGAFHHGATLNPMMLSRGLSSIVHSPGPINPGTGRLGGTLRLASGGQGSRRTALLPQVGSRPSNLGGTWQRSKGVSTVSRNVGAGREGEGSWELLDQLCADYRVRRVAAWLMFAVVTYLSQDFYGTIIGTFILSFVGNSVVNRLEVYVSRTRKAINSRMGWSIPEMQRRSVCLLYFVICVNIITFATLFTVPQILQSWRYLKQVVLSDNPYVELAASIHTLIGGDATSRLEGLLSSVAGAAPVKGAVKSVGKGPSAVLASQLQTQLKGGVLAFYPTIQRVLKSSSQILYQSLLSLLFSFICIYDREQITRGAQRLGQQGSMVQWAYKEIAPKIQLFGSLVGKSLEAQLMIALWNTLLTTAGMVFLGIPGVPILSSLVFCMSFIPLVGVFVSTIPIGLVGLSEAGPLKFVQVLWMVFVVHLIEAYFLNPQIYSSKLKLHPLLVLVSLYITEHTAGVTTLFLAVPVTVFITKLILEEGPRAPESQVLLPDGTEASQVKEA